MKMLKMYRYTILAVFLGVVACSVVPLIAYEGVGLYEIIACKQLLMTDADNDIAIAMTTEQDDYGIVILSTKEPISGIGLTMGKSGLQVAVIRKGEEKAILSVNEYGDGILTLYDRYGKTTVLGMPE